VQVNQTGIFTNVFMYAFTTLYYDAYFVAPSVVGLSLSCSDFVIIVGHVLKVLC